MNIWIVCYPTFGGSGIVATELGQALARKGHQIHFITSWQPVRLDIFADNIFYHEVQVSNYPIFEYKPYESALTSKIVDVAKHEHLDLLHVHYALPHASAAYMAHQILQRQGIQLPFITTLHGTDITLIGKDSSFEPIISFSINESTAVTAVSQSLKNDTYELFHVDKDIHVIPNFVDFADYTDGEGCPEIKAKFAPHGERLIVHVSNFRKVKRVDDVIHIFAKIKKKKAARLLLVGDGPERSRIETLCRELGIADDVHFFGKIKQPEKLLQTCDLFILPSESESFGLAALEAMAAKVPVISTCTGGLPEVNKDGVSGFLSDVGDIGDMVANALKIISDDTTLARFKEQAYRQAETFAIEKIVPMYEGLYERVMKG